MNRELFRLDEISWRGLGMDLLRNLWMILLAAVTVWLAITGLYNITYRPAYTSSATLVVTVQGSSDNYTSLTVTAQMADVFGQVFQSDALRKRIIEDTGEDIEGTISCTAIDETNLLVLRTTSPDPRQAYLFINSALGHYEEVAGNVFSDAVLQVVQEPEVPSAPSNSSRLLTLRNLLAMAGGACMAGVICLFYLLRFTVKTVSGAERQLDGKIRGVIPFEKKKDAAGRRKQSKQALLLNSPVVSMDFAEAGRRAASGIEHHMRSRKQKVLLVTSVTENEGKSTVAANLALALAEKRRKVLLLDGDLRKPAQYKVFEKKGKEGLSFDQVLQKKISWRDAVHYSRSGRIWQLLQFTGISDPSGILNASSVNALLDSMKQEFDYIIIDCSPSAVSTDAEIWMEAVDAVLLVVREDWADVRVINETVDIVWQSGKELLGFLLNAFHGQRFQELRGYGGYGNYAGERPAVRERG